MIKAVKLSDFRNFKTKSLEFFDKYFIPIMLSFCIQIICKKILINGTN